MRDKLLKIYLVDHAALMKGEAALAERTRRENAGSPLADYLARLEGDLVGQRAAARDVLARVGGREDFFKGTAAWAAEKLGRFKLNGTLVRYSPLSRMVELEGLTAVGAVRVAFWDALARVAPSDPRLAGVDFAGLSKQAADRLAELDELRRQAAEAAFVAER